MVSSTHLLFTSLSTPSIPPSLFSPLIPLHYHSYEDPGYPQYSQHYYLMLSKLEAHNERMLKLVVEVMEWEGRREEKEELERVETEERRRRTKERMTRDRMRSRVEGWEVRARRRVEEIKVAFGWV